ncbi:MAG TPA: hypothetical protein VIL09_05335, partial [Microvirga sp.]
ELLPEPAMLIEPIAPRFSCQDCEGSSFNVTGVLNDASVVCCGECGSELGPWRDFAADVTTTLERLGVIHVERTGYARSDGVHRRVPAGRRR